jgi:hypothetical protein
MAIINQTNKFVWTTPNFFQQTDKIELTIMVIKNWWPKIFNHQLWQSKVDDENFLVGQFNDKKIENSVTTPMVTKFVFDDHT